ncbi:hypothetical protein EVAR_34841_1 [Eumeta japonica]|uniref:Uncharacterized protein n=1 Tax=Eumeta variegata TaxID=151549 RepID=A0A4C1YTX9_EUMVA|nr:hypothetical protein EVAR_34841_1 [Eumeta japonica]
MTPSHREENENGWPVDIDVTLNEHVTNNELRIESPNVVSTTHTDDVVEVTRFFSWTRLAQSFDTKSPSILNGRDYTVRLLIEHYHQQACDTREILDNETQADSEKYSQRLPPVSTTTRATGHAKDGRSPGKASRFPAPKDEVLHTLILETEFIVNSRPLTLIYVFPSDPKALTPNHF